MSVGYGDGPVPEGYEAPDVALGAQVPPEPDLIDALVLRPGDRVLVTPKHDMSPREAVDLRDGLGERFPGVTFVVVVGASVVKAEQGPTVAEAIRKVVANANAQMHDTSASKMLAEIADALDGTNDDLRPLPEDARAHVMGQRHEHQDGRVCMHHYRLRAWTPDGLNECLRLH